MTALAIGLVCCVAIVAAVARDVVLRVLDARLEAHRAADVAALATRVDELGAKVDGVAEEARSAAAQARELKLSRLRGAR